MTGDFYCGAEKGVRLVLPRLTSPVVHNSFHKTSSFLINVKKKKKRRRR